MGRCKMLATHALAIEVKHVQDLFVIGTLIDANVPDASHKGEIYDARLVLLVVRHKLV